MRELIDENQRRAAFERNVEIEFPDRRTLNVEHQCWKLLEAFEHRGGLDAAAGHPSSHSGTRFAG